MRSPKAIQPAQALFAATLCISTPLAHAAATHVVTGSAGTGGTLNTTSQTVISGKKAVFLVELKAGYVVNTIGGCDGVLTGMAYTTGTITAPCTVKATFTLAKKYPLTLKTDGDGSGTVSGAGSFIAGSNVQLTARPANGSTFTGWRPSLCTDSFSMPTKNLTCTATFILNQSTEAPEMVAIPGRCFQMGNLETEDHGMYGNAPSHEVCLNGFEIGKYEVTFAEYDRFAEATGRRKPDDNGWGRGKRPVIDVDWDDAMAYAAWLTQQTAQNYRLPTEAEWEFMARAGTTTEYWTGKNVTVEQANFNMYFGKTIEVGSYPANPWGLYDTMGNVWEWTCSLYDRNYENGDETRCATVGTGGSRAIRGGAWHYNGWGEEWALASATRNAASVGQRSDRGSGDLGFRLVRY